MKLHYVLAATGLLFANLAHAAPVTILDSASGSDGYWGAQPGIYRSSGGVQAYGSYANRDVIGDAKLFDIQKMELDFIGDKLQVKIFTNYVDGTLGTRIGDLFISTNGWSPAAGCASPPYACDNLKSSGQQWEYAYQLKRDSNGYATGGGKLVAIGGNDGASVRTTNDAFGVSHKDNWIYRIDQPTQTAGGKKIRSDSSVDLSKMGYQGFLTFTIDLAALNHPTDIGLLWNMSCGNDTIAGHVRHAVPEPATLGLLLLGMLSVGLLARRRPVTVSGR